MVTSSNVLVVTIVILVCNCNTVICQVNGCNGRDFRCGRNGPPIRFPFRLKDNETEYGCSYPGFELTCSDNKTLLELPTHSGPIKLEVLKIDYQLQVLYLSDPENCLRKQFLKLLHSQISPFQLFEASNYNSSYTFMDCSSLSCPVYVADSTDTLLDSGLDPILCTKTLDIIDSPVIPPVYHDESLTLTLTWSKPNCSKCEIEGKMCKLKTNGSEDEVECFDRHHKPTKKIALYATAVFVSSVHVILILTSSLRLYSYFKLKGEDETRIEKFLEDYRTLNPARFPYAEITTRKYVICCDEFCS